MSGTLVALLHTDRGTSAQMPILKNTGDRNWYVKFANGEVIVLSPGQELTFRCGTAVIPIEVIPRYVRVKKRPRKRDAGNRHLHFVKVRPLERKLDAGECARRLSARKDRAVACVK
jgi:hypothetical protein